MRSNVKTASCLQPLGAIRCQLLNAGACAKSVLLKLGVRRKVLTVRCPVTNNEVCVAAFKVRNDLLRNGVAGDVALQLRHAFDGRHRLQVHGNYRRQIRGPATRIFVRTLQGRPLVSSSSSRRCQAQTPSTAAKNTPYFCDHRQVQLPAEHLCMRKHHRPSVPTAMTAAECLVLPTSHVAPGSSCRALRRGLPRSSRLYKVPDVRGLFLLHEMT